MKKFKRIVMGVVMSYVLTIALLMVFALILVKSSFNENYSNIVIAIISSTSILISASISTKKIKSSGIWSGLAIAGIYYFVMYICSGILYNEFSFNINTIYMMVASAILGMIGGIIGVNTKGQG